MFCLVEAENDVLAYQKCLSVARGQVGRTSELVGGSWRFDGISDLLEVIDEPHDGSELTWIQLELASDQISTRVRSERALTVFSDERGEEGADLEKGWYICKTVLREVVDTDSHGNTELVWINSHLIEARDGGSAFLRALEIGRAESRGPHKCDDDDAHFEFCGLNNLVRCLSAPVDGAVLSYGEFRATPQELAALLPD